MVDDVNPESFADLLKNNFPENENDIDIEI